jgi:cytochrome P450
MPGDTSVDELDRELLAPSFFADPHPIYSQLRALRPVHRSRALDCWLLTCHADIVSCLRDARFSSVGRAASVLDRIDEPCAKERLKPLYDHFSVGLIHSDPPAHTRIRSLINKAFTPRRVDELRPRLQELVDELVDRVENLGGMDVIADLAFPLPVTVISEALGLPIDDRARFKLWCDTINGILAARHTLQSALVTQESVLALRAFVSDLIAIRRREPQDDLLSHLIQAQTEGDHLSEVELIQTTATMLIAAHETTTNLIANGILALLENPSELERLRCDHNLFDIAIEEFLRYESPLNHFTRITTEDVELRGEHIRTGDLVTFSILAANRDPGQFDHPNQLDVGRKNNRHIAFGFGPHFCLGASLARLEGRIAIETLLRRFPNLRLATSEIEWRHDRVLRATKALPVLF